MGICDSCGNVNKPQNTNSENPNLNIRNNVTNNNLSTIDKNISFTCIYDVKDINDDIQIINNTNGSYINEEIQSKIKILNNGQKEKLVLKKKFERKGKNSIHFIIEGKLNNMSYMFNQCSSLKYIYFISFETDQVINMKAMFQECNELEYLDLSNFNTINVTDMSWMFNNCHKLKEIKGINNFNTIKVTKMNSMFNMCYELEYLDLSNFNTSNVTNMEAIFNICSNLKEIKGINKFNTINVINMSIMFQ